MSGLYGRYHGRIAAPSEHSTTDGAWKTKLREILAEFDEDCSRLSISANRALRRELATQIEQEILRFSGAEKGAVLALALKHLDAEES
jgi:hypothetical protein